MTANNKTVQDVYRNKARQLEGPQTVNGMAYNSDTIGRMIATRDVYALQLKNFISQTVDQGNASQAVKDARIRAMLPLASRIEQAYFLSAASGPSTGAQDATIINMEADALARAGNKADADWLRSVANLSGPERAQIAQQEITRVVDLEPLLGVSAPGWFGKRLSTKIATEVTGGLSGVYPNGVTEVRPLLDEYIRYAIDQANEEINRVNGINTVQGMSEFFKPQYVRARFFAGNMYGGMKEVQSFEEFAKFYADNADAEAEQTKLTLAIVVGGIAVVAIVAAPLAGLAAAQLGAGTGGVATTTAIVSAVGSGINLGAMGVQLVWDGKQWIAVSSELANAEKGAGVLGQSNIQGLRDKQQAATGQVALDVVFAAVAAKDFKASVDNARAAAARGATGANSVATGATTATDSTAAAAKAIALTPELQAIANELGQDVALGVRAGRMLKIPEERIQNALNLARLPENLKTTPLEVLERQNPMGLARLKAGISSQQAITNLRQVNEIVVAARSAGVSEGALDAAWEAAQKAGTVEAWGVGLRRQLGISEAMTGVHAGRGVILIGPKELGDLTAQELIPFQQAQATGGMLQTTYGKDLLGLRAKITLLAKGKAGVVLNPTELRLLKDQVLPGGEGILKWFGYDSEVREFFPIFDRRFIQDLRSALESSANAGNADARAALAELDFATAGTKSAVATAKAGAAGGTPGAQIDVINLQANQVSQLSNDALRTIPPKVIEMYPLEVQQAIRQEITRRGLVPRPGVSVQSGQIALNPQAGAQRFADLSKRLTNEDLQRLAAKLASDPNADPALKVAINNEMAQRGVNSAGATPQPKPGPNSTPGTVPPPQSGASITPRAGERPGTPPGTASGVAAVVNAANTAGANACGGSGTTKGKTLTTDQFNRMQRLLLMQEQGVTPANPAEYSDLPSINELSENERTQLSYEFQVRGDRAGAGGNADLARVSESIRKKLLCPPPDTRTTAGGNPPQAKTPVGQGTAAPPAGNQPNGNLVAGGTAQPSAGAGATLGATPGATSGATLAPCAESGGDCGAAQDAYDKSVDEYNQADSAFSEAGTAATEAAAAMSAAGSALEQAKATLPANSPGLAVAQNAFNAAQKQDAEAVAAQRTASANLDAARANRIQAQANLEKCEQAARQKCEPKSATSQPPTQPGGNSIGGNGATGGEPGNKIGGPGAVTGGTGQAPQGGNVVGGTGGGTGGSPSGGGNVVGVGPQGAATCKRADGDCAELGRIAAQKQLEAIQAQDDLRQVSNWLSEAESLQQQANNYHDQVSRDFDLARQYAQLKDTPNVNFYTTQAHEDQIKGDAFQAKAAALKAKAEGAAARAEALAKEAQAAWNAYHACLQLPPCPEDAGTSPAGGNVIGGGASGKLVNVVGGGGTTGGTTGNGFANCPQAQDQLDQAKYWYQQAAIDQGKMAQALATGDANASRYLQNSIAIDVGNAQRHEREAAYALEECNRKSASTMPGGNPSNMIPSSGTATPASQPGSGNSTNSVGAIPNPSVPAGTQPGSASVPAATATAMEPPPAPGSTSACMAANDTCKQPNQCAPDQRCVNMKDICKTSPSACSTNTSGDSPYQVMVTASPVVPAKSSEFRQGPRFIPASYHSGHGIAGVLAETLLAEMPVPDDKGQNPAVSLVATGNSSGEAFQLQVHDPSGKMTSVAMPEGVVLEPVKPGSAKPPAARGMSGLITQQVGGFCVQYLKLPPELGMVYKIAGPAMQQKFEPMRLILQAGRSLAEKGKLHPDSDPQAYADSVRQYAVWASQEGWDEKKFGDNFVDRTKKNAVARKVQWTPQIENALRAVVSGRWRDISQVLDLASAWGKASSSQPARSGN